MSLRVTLGEFHFTMILNTYFSRCSIWLAVDVWMCTASILHLVVISLDRYIAVTQPMKYPNLMTSKKAKLLITGAWILSFVICFPPLVGWTDNKDEDDGTNSDLNNTQSKPVLYFLLNFISHYMYIR